MAKLTALDTFKYHGFGISVAITGKLAVICASSAEEDIHKYARSAYVFGLDNLKEIRILTPRIKYDRSMNWIVSASEGRAVLTAISSFGGNSTYTYDIENGEQIAEISNKDSFPLDLFGCSACIYKEKVVVGSPGPGLNRDRIGSAFVYDAIKGEYIYKLISKHAVPFDDFGSSVAISDTFIAVGAPSTDLPHAKEAGAVYVFESKTGKEVAKITANPVVKGGRFGHSVAICGNLAIVGAPGQGPIGGKGFGVAYVFNLNSYEQISVLTAAESRKGDGFGSSVAISEGLAVIGAPFADQKAEDKAGMAYGFDPMTGRELVKFVAEDIQPISLFGISVAANSDWVVIGSSMGDSDTSQDTGAVYVFKIPAK